MFKKFTAYNPDPETVARDWRGRWNASGNALAFKVRNETVITDPRKAAMRPVRLAALAIVAALIGATAVAVVSWPDRPCIVTAGWTELTRVGDRLCETDASLAGKYTPWFGSAGQ